MILATGECLVICFVNSTSSKTGLKAFMEVLAIELALYGVRVNMIVPGAFVTKMVTENDFFTAETGRGKISEIIIKNEIPMRRMGKPEEVGPTAALLLSDKLSGYTTGSAVVIDGGVRINPTTIYTDDEILKFNAPAGE